ncbi:probable disease resistance protein At4g27220 [Euphorbia lathyris]|uniref:probable disease resistance protein At4g27220 n=1 Tax=Euphorbia lathyris TaxID=212925 RepID=UPI0033133940
MSAPTINREDRSHLKRKLDPRIGTNKIFNFDELAVTSKDVSFEGDPIKQYIVTPIKQHISYTFNCDSKVERLHREVEQLKNKRVRLQQSVGDATRNGEEIYPNVTKWLTTVEKDIEEAEKLIQGKEEAKKKCFIGFCPNLKTRYQLSKKADRKASVIGNLLQEAQGSSPISFRPPLQPIVEDFKYSRDALPSRVLIFDQIMGALKDPNLNMIGVYGMGGVGKTTIAKEVLGQTFKEKLFETVVMVPVSQTPDLRRIQGEIASFLNMQFNAEEVLGRASQLHQRLKKAKVLIILDDVWQKLDLNAVGIPFGDACEGCKILLTSRRKHVLSNEMCTQKEFRLDVLEEEETWRLFKMSVSKATDPELRDIATEVAKKCAGLPLLILKVATDLRNKDLYAWKDMLTQLSSLENTEIYWKVHKVIESSYEKLIDEEAKSLFLLCPLFGNSNIRIRNLLFYCMGLGLFKHMDSIEGASNRVLTLVDKLKDECLLLDGDRVGFVKIHDVVRDIALAIACRVQHAFVGTTKVRSTDLRNKDCTRICLPYCDIPQLPEVLECPKAEVFSLFGSYLSLDIPNSFFEGVTKLRVLDFTGVYFLSGLPSSLGFLTGLQTLCLHGCWFNNVAIVAELKQLELLSFADSNIVELPREIMALTQLKLLDLRGCCNLQVIPANVLSNLCLLEELYMLNSFHGWGAEGNASLVELKNLSQLTTLEIQVKDDKLLPKDWFFDGLRNYRISIGNWYGFDNIEYESSRMLKLELQTSIGLTHRIKEFLRETEVLYLGAVKGIEKLLYDSEVENLNRLENIDCGHFGIISQKLRILDISKCNELMIVFPFSCDKCLPQLLQMKVLSCENMEAVVGEGGEVIEFTRLSSLTLGSLPHLIGFCKTSGMVSFPNLTSFEVYKCKSLKYVFTTSMAKSLKQLKKLQISECELMEEVILGNKFEEIEGKSFEHIMFPKLDYLHLYGLPNLTTFCGGYPIEFSKLRELRIENCFALKNFVSKSSDRSNNNENADEYLFNELVAFSDLEIIYFRSMKNLRYLWHQHFADDDSFSKLKSLKIEHCSKLSVVFPSNVYRRFRRLESLSLSNCDRVEEIYEYQRVRFEGTNIPRKDIDEALSFENLQSVEVHSSPDLKYVFPASIAHGLLQLQHLEISYCGVEMIIADAKNAGSECDTARTFEWPNLKCLKVYGCDKFIKFGFNICKGKHNVPTQDSLYFIEKVITNVEVLTLDHHSLKAIQNEGFPVEFVWQLKQVAMLSLKEESIPFLFGFLRRIDSLDKLSLQYSSLGESFSLDDERAVGEEQQYRLRLKDFELKCICNLKHIVKKDSQLNPILQCLQTLNLLWCYDLMNIAPSLASFQNLTTLKVQNCEQMTSLVTASTAKTMVHLMELSVSNCYEMEEIVANDGDCSEHDVIIFKKLKHLKLAKLYKLNSFCSGNYVFNFPLLEKVFIEECNEMEIFCGGVLSTPILGREGNLDAIIAHKLEENGLVDIYSSDAE